MANGDGDIVQKVVIEVDDQQLSKIGETASESLDKLKEGTDKASDSLGKLGEKAGETSKDLEKVGEGADEGLKKVDDASGKAGESLGKLGDKAGDTQKDLEKVGEGADEGLKKVEDKADDAKSALEKLGESGKNSLEDIQKGADYAGTSLENFAKLSEHTQEQYIEYAKRITDANRDVAESFKGMNEQGGSAQQGLGKVGGGLNEVSEKSGISSREMRAFGKILSSFGLGEITGPLLGLSRVVSVLGPAAGIALAAGLAATALAKFGKQAEATAEAADKLARVVGDTPETLERMARGFEQAGGKLKDFIKYVEDTTIKMQALNELKGLSDEQQKSLIDGANNVEKLTKKIEEALTASDKWPTSLNNIGTAVKNTIDPLTKSSTLIEALEKAIIKSGKAFVDGKFSIEAYHDELNKFYNSLDETGKLLLRTAWEKAGVPKETIDTLIKTREEYDKLKQSLKDTQWRADAYKEFDQFFKHLKDGFGDVLKDWTAAFAAGVPRLFTTFRSGFLEPIGEAFSKLGQMFTAGLGQLGSDIRDAANNLAKSFIEGFINPIVEAWKKLGELADQYMLQPIKDTWNAIVDYVTEKANAIIKAVQDAWKDFKDLVYDTFYKPVKDAWDQAVEYISGKVETVIGYLKSIKQAAIDAWSAIKSMFSAGAGEGGGAGAAAGGYIVGAGSSTSDSIPAWLSTGEFVMRAAAVQAYGLRAMYAMNSLQAPRFAAGGMAFPISRSPTPSTTGQRTLNLVIEGRSFQGLQVPERTAQSLERFAVHSQIASAGRKQSWRR